MSGRSGEDLQAFLTDAGSASPVTQASVTQRLMKMQRMPVAQRAAIVLDLANILGDTSIDPITRRMAGSVLKQVAQPPEAQASAMPAVPMSELEEPLLLALCDADRGVQSTAAWCISEAAKFHFSTRGSGWPNLPAKLDTLCASGEPAFQRGAATCLALIAEDAGRLIVTAHGDAAAELRSRLLQIIVGLIDEGLTVECRRKAVSAATHFIRAAAAPTVDLNDFNEEGEISEEADSRYHVGQEQLKQLVSVLAPRFVTFFASLAENAVGALYQSHSGDALLAYFESDEEVLKDINATVDGFNTLLSFDDLVGEHIAPALQNLVALFVSLSWALKNATSSAITHSEKGIHAFATAVLTLTTDLVIADDAGTAAVSRLDGGEHEEYEVVVPPPPEAIAPLLEIVGCATLRDAFFGAMTELGMKLSTEELEGLTFGADCHLPDLYTDVNFVLHRPDDAGEVEQDDLSDDLNSSTSSNADGLSAVRHATTWCLNTMSSVMCDEMLASLLPHVAQVLGSRDNITIDETTWETFEHVLLIAAELVDNALPQLVSRGVADHILEAALALSSTSGAAAQVAPLRVAALKVLGKFATSIVDLAVGTVKSKRLPVAQLAPLGGQCVAALGAALEDSNKKVQKAAFESLTTLTAHVAALADDGDEDDDGFESEEDDEEAGAAAGGAADGGSSSALLVLLPLEVIAAIYTAATANYAQYQLVSRSLLYDLLSATAGADTALAQLHHNPPVLCQPPVVASLLDGLVSTWQNFGATRPGADATAVREAAAVAECLATLIRAVNAESVRVVEPVVALAAEIMAIRAGDASAGRQDQGADEDLISTSIDLISSLSEALGPDLAFEHLLSPALLSAVGALASVELGTEDSCEIKRAAFALLGDFATAVSIRTRTLLSSSETHDAATAAAIIRTAAEALAPFTEDVFTAVVRSLFAYRVEHVRANVNALFCAGEWVIAMPREVVAEALVQSGTNGQGLTQFATMITYFASSNAVERGGDGTFRQNAISLVARLLFAFPSVVAPLLTTEMNAALGVEIPRLQETVERADSLWRIGMALSIAGDDTHANAGIAAACACGLALDVAVDDIAGYAAVAQALSASPRASLLLAAAAVTIKPCRRDDAYCKTIAAGVKHLWAPIVAMLLNNCDIESKDVKKHFTKAQRTALVKAAASVTSA